MPKNSSISNFKILARALLRIVLFLLFLEGFLTLGGWISLLSQESFNRPINGNYRILCLGDSITARGGEFSYPYLLQNALNKAQSAVKFQVINKGRVGWSSTEISGHFEELYQKYHPDMVIIMMGLTDQMQFYSLIPVNQKVRIQFLLLDRIKVYRLARKLLAETLSTLPIHSKENIPGELAQDTAKLQTFSGTENATKSIVLSDTYWNIVHYHPLTVRNYNDLIELSLRKGTRVVVMQYPLLSIAPLKEIIYFKDQVMFIDNGAIFKEIAAKKGYEKLFLDPDGHFTPEGASLLVANLSERILKTARKTNDN